MKIVITLTANGTDQKLGASSVAAAQAVVMGFCHALAVPHHFSPQTLKERKAASQHYLTRNASWHAEITG